MNLDYVKTTEKLIRLYRSARNSLKHNDFEEHCRSVIEDQGFGIVIDLAEWEAKYDAMTEGIIKNQMVEKTE